MGFEPTVTRLIGDERLLITFPKMKEGEQASPIFLVCYHYTTDPSNGPARIRTWTTRSIYDERDSITSLKTENQRAERSLDIP